MVADLLTKAVARLLLLFLHTATAAVGVLALVDSYATKPKGLACPPLQDIVGGLCPCASVCCVRVRPQMNDFSISHTAQDTGLALTSKLELVSECEPVSLATHKRLRVFMPPHASASVLVLGSS